MSEYGRASSMDRPIRVTHVRKADPSEWDEIYEGCGYATYFHSREWAEIWAAYTGRSRPHGRLVTFSDGTTALLPLSCRKMLRGFAWEFLSSPAGTFGGWLSADELSAGHADQLTHELTALGSLTWRANPYDPLAGAVPLPDAMPDTTLVVPLDGDFDAILRGFSKGHRSAVRKARREGVTVGRAATLDDWRAYFEIYRDSIRRWGDAVRISYSFRLFEIMADAGSESIKLWLARTGDEVVSGALCLYGPRHVVYWHGASAERSLKLRPSNLVVHDAMAAACREGYRWFDFNPSGGHEGVASFKRSFGAEPRSCPVVRRTGRREAFFRRVAGIVRKGERRHAR